MSNQPNASQARRYENARTAALLTSTVAWMLDAKRHPEFWATRSAAITATR